MGAVVLNAEPVSVAAADGKEELPPVFDPSVQIGAMAPLGFFDPAGFCKKGDESGFRNLRAAEIKHGRVAMMAAVGAVAQHYIKFPGFESVPAGLSAVLSPPGTWGMIALFLVAGALELGVWTESPSKEPGNFGDPLSLGQYDAEMRSRELNNGRFAMFAALGIISAELLTGKDAIEQFGLWLCADSLAPCRWSDLQAPSPGLVLCVAPSFARSLALRLFLCGCTAVQNFRAPGGISALGVSGGRYRVTCPKKGCSETVEGYRSAGDFAVSPWTCTCM